MKTISLPAPWAAANLQRHPARARPIPTMASSSTPARLLKAASFETRTISSMIQNSAHRARFLPMPRSFMFARPPTAPATLRLDRDRLSLAARLITRPRR
jgi:hypothetical protein